MRFSSGLARLVRSACSFAGAFDIDYRTGGLGEATFPLTVRSASGDPLLFPPVAGTPGFESRLYLSIVGAATGFGLTGLFSTVATAGGLAVPGSGGSIIPLPAAAPLFLGALAFGGFWRRRAAMLKSGNNA